jgi:hypothetical protein
MQEGDGTMLGEIPPRKSYQGLTAGASFIIMALAILVAWSSGDWWLLIPMLLLCFGIFGIFMGALMSTADQRKGFGVSDSAYTLVWGCLLTILGIAWFINGYLPDSLPLILALILIFIGGAILAISLTKKRKTQ